MFTNLAHRFTPLLLVSALYGGAIAKCSQLGDSLASIAVLVVFLVLFIVRFRDFPGRQIQPEIDLIAHQVAITLGVVGGLYLGEAEVSVLWPLDAINTHLPLSQNVAQVFRGSLEWAEAGLHIPGASIHVVTGFMIFVFGPSTTLTALTLLLFKLGTIVLIYRLGKSLFNQHAGYTAALLYLLAPTVQFYTLNFYKEASVHFFVISSFYFMHLFYMRQKVWAIVPFACALLLLTHERFYLVFLMLPSLALLTLFAPAKYRILKWLIGLGILFVLIQNNIYLRKSPEWVLERLDQFRAAHMRFDDFSYNLNYEIPYALAVFKSLFTPYFTLKKLQTFLDLSNLLTWGSFLNQITILGASWAFYKSLRNDWVNHLAMILPFLVLLLFLGYISPWSGRIRDSYYPIISLYAGLFFSGHMYRPFIESFKSRTPRSSDKGQ